METGTDLARRYYDEVVGPIVLGRWPGLPHAAGRLGSGSDVLGLDDATSRDHDWGLRLTLLVDEPMVDEVDALLDAALPRTFAGHPTRFPTTWSPHGPHQVEAASPSGFVTSRLGVDATRPLAVDAWLALTGQAVLEVTAGPVFVDTEGALSAARDRLAWYPDDLWRYAVAVDWARIGQELPFVGRTAERGDDLGSRVVAARLVRVAMHLGFLLERRWPPYAKWFGTAFAALPRAGAVGPDLAAALAADDWRSREAALCRGLETLHDLQGEVGLPTVADVVVPFFDRPYRGLGPVADAVTAAIQDPAVRALPPGVGTVEQWVDDVDVLTDPGRRVAAARGVGQAGTTTP
ncbi:DUF4037 domain-containing protein [Cellulosimicrobium sp. E-16]|uniref:DUF4037 domain-containing protein n=1 Tax=Cellulosimicrobium sp. E-16 TaxID=3404049 RepID=UPI003CFA5D64